MDQQPKPLADRIAAAFERLDAQQWGYDHGFCGTFGTDPETDSFVNASLAVVQPDLDELRGQLETALVRLHHIQARVEQTSLTNPASHLALDLMPWLDGPIHADDIAAYHAAQETPCRSPQTRTSRPPKTCFTV